MMFEKVIELARSMRNGSSSFAPRGSIEFNKIGQALGKKGNKTRLLLMNATRRLLVDHSPVELTAVSVAREAGTSAATFYNYFNDVRDVIFHMSVLAGLEMSEVHRILDEPWDPTRIEIDHAIRVVKAFFAVWDHHRDILRFRNLEADRGDKAFHELRYQCALPIITRLAERIIAGYPPRHHLGRGDAYAVATSLSCAMEGLAAVDPELIRSHVSLDTMITAMARLIATNLTETEGL